MDTNAVAAAVFGSLIGAGLVQIAHRPGRRIQLMRMASVMTGLGVLTELVTNGGGHSHSAHGIVFAVVLGLLASALIFLIMSQRSGAAGPVTPISNTNEPGPSGMSPD